jgi:hypothetical protein
LARAYSQKVTSGQETLSLRWLNTQHHRIGNSFRFS